jgi:WD40 repeat protein
VEERVAVLLTSYPTSPIHFISFYSRRPLSSYTISTPAGGETSKPQVCNPPMVHSLSWSPSGRLLAAGLGDGNVPIFSIENRNLVQTGFLSEGHDSSVASIVFFDKHERILFSGGSDGAILCWDLGANVVGDNNNDDDDSTSSSVNLFPESFLRAQSSSSNNNNQEEDLVRRTQELLSLDQPKILFGIPHGPKVNWMTTSGPSTLFVADTSNDITAYTIPLR